MTGPFINNCVVGKLVRSGWEVGGKWVGSGWEVSGKWVRCILFWWASINLRRRPWKSPGLLLQPGIVHV